MRQGNRLGAMLMKKAISNQRSAGRACNLPKARRSFSEDGLHAELFVGWALFAIVPTRYCCSLAGS